METLIAQIKELENGKIGEQIRKKMLELKENRKTKEKVFSELCFCLTTANSSAEMGIKVQNAIGSRVETLTLEQLTNALRKLGYRFYNVRAKYIFEARKHKENVWAMVRECHNDSRSAEQSASYEPQANCGSPEFELRDWLVDNVKGLGFKEASHFLRNLGFKDVAILDRHILRTLCEKGLINSVPASLNEKKYLQYEKELEKICRMTGLKQGELDFYLWYLKTGKILK